MKRNNAYFDLTVLKKDMTRFLPLWGIYLVGGLLVMLTALSNQEYSRAAYSLAQTIGPLSIINMIYAGLCAMLLFGDLFNSRMCNALHALPVRREGWLLTHVTAGLLFSIVPHGIIVLLMAPMLQDLWMVALCWWLGMTLEYIFFFGLAVFSVMCTGNRFASLTVYGILNFGSLIAGWFITTIYQPLMYGIIITDRYSSFFSPVVTMTSMEMAMVRLGTHPVYRYAVFKGLQNAAGWHYISVCAAIGIGLLALSLVLYRRRKLECAGDFIAARPLGPVFAVVFALTIGCLFDLFGTLFASDSNFLFLTIGMVVGWYSSQMLLQRTVKVFNRRTFGKLSLLWLTILLTMGLTWLDPLGVNTYIPKESQIASVHAYGSYQENKTSNTPESIQKAIRFHETALQERDADFDSISKTVHLSYTLKSGIRVTREYTVYLKSEAWTHAAELFDKPIELLRWLEEPEWQERINKILINGADLEDLCRQYNDTHDDKIDPTMAATALIDALQADNEKGLISSKMDHGNTCGHYVTIDFSGEYSDRSFYPVGWAYHTQEWLDTYMDRFAPPA